MKDQIKNGLRFLLSAAIYHVVTYFIAGFIASAAFNYADIFRMPVISEYYRPSESTAFYIGPLLQVIRGLLFGLVLLPLRSFLKSEKLGWLWLWLIFIVIGIISTPAAAPASIEGVIYTKLPVWFHLMGLPEIMLQTLAFSFLMHRSLRAKDHPLPEIFKMSIQALVFTCISFIGYTVISIIFALFSGAAINQNSADYKVLGQFIAPLIITFIIVLSGMHWIIQKHILMYLLSALSIGLYQKLILGSAGLVYVFTAPIIPVLISYIMLKVKAKNIKNDPIKSK